MAVDVQISQQQMRETMNLRNRQSIRQPKNPMDRCTIVSIYPLEAIQVNHTIEPGRFVIPAGSIEEPSILVVGSSSWWKDIDAEQPLIEIPCGSVQVAESIVKDYFNSMMFVDSHRRPGVFFVHGEMTVLDIKLKYKNKLKEVEAEQRNWFTFLVQAADSLWARSNGNPFSISDQMRLAARTLGLEDKPWLQNFVAAALEKCFACGTLKNPEYPVCPACRAIDPNHKKSKDIKFAVQ